jgi:ubiquitin-protein ligase
MEKIAKSKDIKKKSNINIIPKIPKVDSLNYKFKIPKETQEERLLKEYENFKKYKPANAWGGPLFPNFFEWIISFYGPKDSDYEDGLFNVKMIIPKDYPYNGPTCYFLHDELYHPNVSQSDKKICLGKYFSSQWNESKTLNEVIMHIYTILKIPNYDDSFDSVICEIYKADPDAFHKIVRE